MAAVIAIGSSTGGPKVLKEIFTGMPRLGVSILLVQHMPKYINEGLRASLDRVTDMDVVLARDGMDIAPGRFFIAPGDLHMTIERNRTLRLNAGAPVCHVCPAIDVLMTSFKPSPPLNLMGVILTGMGRDGADGMVHLKALGAKTLAQEKQSCAVFGMPQRAIETGAVDFVGSPAAIARKIREAGTVARANRSAGLTA